MKLYFLTSFAIRMAITGVLQLVYLGIVFLVFGLRVNWPLLLTVTLVGMLITCGIAAILDTRKNAKC